MLEVTKNTLVPVVGTFQCSEKLLISAKHLGMRLSIQAWEMITHNPTEKEREREGENHWFSCDYVMFGIM